MLGLAGTEGYAEEAEQLFERYEGITMADVHRLTLPLIPRTPCRILDIGAGTGRDAAGFAGLGHRVVAVEPVDVLRLRAAALHGSPDIEWIDDGLPALRKVRERDETFDVVALTAVWMHLDEEQRRQAMPVVASLASPGGLVILSLRHGAVPPGRRMFEVSARETVRLAMAEGLGVLLNERAFSAIPRPDGVVWTWLVFAKPA